MDMGKIFSIIIWLEIPGKLPIIGKRKNKKYHSHNIHLRLSKFNPKINRDKTKE